jgi:carbon monoxide dehydrogenase subunit G
MNLNFRLNKSPDLVFDYLTDMQKFVSVHPVISKINDLGENNYKVFETLKFGFIPFSFTYPVTIASNFKERSIVIKATVMKLNKIEMVFKITVDNGITIVDESIHFETIFPIKSIMKSIFTKQHHILFKNIEQLD